MVFFRLGRLRLSSSWLWFFFFNIFLPSCRSLRVTAPVDFKGNTLRPEILKQLEESKKLMITKKLNQEWNKGEKKNENQLSAAEKENKPEPAKKTTPKNKQSKNENRNSKFKSKVKEIPKKRARIITHDDSSGDEGHLPVIIHSPKPKFP